MVFLQVGLVYCIPPTALIFDGFGVLYQKEFASRSKITCFKKRAMDHFILLNTKQFSRGTLDSIAILMNNIINNFVKLCVIEFKQNVPIHTVILMFHLYKEGTKTLKPTLVNVVESKHLAVKTNLDKQTGYHLTISSNANIQVKQFISLLPFITVLNILKMQGL